MTEYDRELSIGEQQLVRRGPEPSDGWRDRHIIRLDEGESALLRGGSLPTRRRPRGHGGPTPPTPPPPDPPPAPEASGIQGFARLWFLANGKSGGSLDVDNIHTPAPDAVVMPCSTFAQYRTALLDSRKRFIKLIGSSVLDGAQSDFKVDNDQFTVDGSGYTGGGAKAYKMLVRCGDQIWTQMKLAPGEGATAGQSADRRAISWNSGSGGAISGIAFDHMCGFWGPDVALSALNGVHWMTWQYSMLGPSIYESNGGGHGYGPNVTNSKGGVGRVTRLTVYRNLMPFNRHRNIRLVAGEIVDEVNNVIYGYGDDPGEGNPVGCNIIGNVFKKSPDSTSSDRCWRSDVLGGNDITLFPDSVYWDDNIGMEADGSPFTPTMDFVFDGVDAERATPYDQHPSHASHGALDVAAADSDLVDDVVANAGRTYQDANDIAIKAHVLAGTGLGGNGFYNGAGFPAPHPSWVS